MFNSDYFPDRLSYIFKNESESSNMNRQLSSNYELVRWFLWFFWKIHKFWIIIRIKQINESKEMNLYSVSQITINLEWWISWTVTKKESYIIRSRDSTTWVNSCFEWLFSKESLWQIFSQLSLRAEWHRENNAIRSLTSVSSSSYLAFWMICSDCFCAIVRSTCRNSVMQSFLISPSALFSFSPALCLKLYY